MNGKTIDSLKTLCDDDVDRIITAPGSRIRWKCGRCGTSYRATVRMMLKAEKQTGYLCPVCAGLVLVKGYNDLATRHPRIAKRLKPGIDPSAIPVSRKGALDFICDKGHAFRSTIRRMIEDDSCPVCRSGGYVSDDDALAKEWDTEANLSDPDAPDSMDGVLIGSNRKAHWVCSVCGHRWVSRIFNRGVKHSGCPECKRAVISAKAKARYAKRNPLSSCRSAASAWDYELNEDTPEEISAGSPSRRWFKCERGHEYLLKVNAVAKSGFHCRKCDVSDPISGHEDIMAYFDDDSADPSTIGVDNYYTKLDWLCPVCGQRFVSVVTTMLSRMHSRNTMCPVCGMYELVPGVNDLATTRPDLASELADPSKASTVTEMSNVKLEWLCMDVSAHGAYVTTPRQRVAGVGCKTCMASKKALERNRKWLDSGRSDPVPQWIMDYAIPEDRERMISQSMSAGSPETVTIVYPDCGHERRTTICNMGRSPECPICAYGLHMSSGQEGMTSWLRGLLGSDAVESNRSGILDGKRELDIWIPSKGIAVEYNGLYWHNEDHCGTTSAFDKWSECRRKGIRLLTVWDDDWQRRRSLVKRVVGSIIMGADKSGAGAAVSAYAHADKSMAAAFMARNSLLPWDDAPFRLAAVDDHRYVAMMVGGMADNGSFTVSGYADVFGDGRYFSDLLQRAESELSPRRIMAGLDHCLYAGDELSGLGFLPVSESGPRFFYAKGGIERVHVSDTADKSAIPVASDAATADGGICKVYDAGHTNLVLPNLPA